MSVEIMLFQTIEAVGKLAVKVTELTEATLDLIEVTKSVHRERVVQLRQEFEEAKMLDDPNNFRLFYLQERLKALEIGTGGEVPAFEPPRLNGKPKAIGAKVPS